MRLLIWLLFAGLTVYAADEQEHFYESFSYHVVTTENVDDARTTLAKYLSSVHAIIKDVNKNINEKSEELSVTFSVSNDKKDEISSLLTDIGRSSLVAFKKVNYEDEITHNRYNKALLEEIKQQYKDQFKIFQRVSDKNSMRDTIDKIRHTTNDIYGIQKDIKQLSRDTSLDHYQVKFTKKYLKKIVKSEDNKTIEDKFSPSSMGIDYTLINVESPKDSFSSSFYGGYEISYLFSNDQTVFKIASLGSIPALTDKTDTQMSKLFFLSYGQNFYGREFGNEESVFASLYSGFDAGGYIATLINDTVLYRMFVTTHLGYELFQNEYVKLDFKASYFLPFGIDELASFRGFKYNFSARIILD